MPNGMDFVSDKNHTELVRLSQQYAFPDFVKSADLNLTLNPSEATAPITTYADPVRRQYPCHTKAATWLSALWFEEKKAEFHTSDRRKISDRLDQYIGFWKIKEAVHKMRSQFGDLHKEAQTQLPDSMFGYVWTEPGTGKKERYLRMSNPMEVKVAAEYLNDNRARLPFRDRNTIARKICERANHYGVGLGKLAEFVERQAGRGVCDPAEVVQMIRQRSMLTKDAGLRERFHAMANEVQSLERRALMPDVLVKLAETMDMLDRGLGVKYGGTVVPPEDIIFKATFTKTAEEVMQHVSTTSGKVYEKTAFKRVDLAALRDAFGPEFVKQSTTHLGDVDTEKLAELVTTLPRGDAELFDAIMSDCGVAPSLTKAAAVRQGFSAEEFAAWEAAYATF